MDIKETRISMYIASLSEDGLPTDDLEALYKSGEEFIADENSTWRDYYIKDAETGEDKLIGFISTSNPVEGSRIHIIHGAYIDPAYRDKGYGTSMIEEELSKYPCDIWCYAVANSNIAGRRFMTSLFVKSGYVSCKLKLEQPLPGHIFFSWQPSEAMLRFHEKQAASAEAAQAAAEDSESSETPAAEPSEEMLR